jgi:hypothetical protein
MAETEPGKPSLCFAVRYPVCAHGHLDCCGHHDLADDQLHPPTAAESYEQVDAPAHYRLPGGIEVFDLIEDLPFCLGSAIKYLLRAGKKPGTDADIDLRKAAFCLQREIDRRRRGAERRAPQTRRPMTREDPT